jgi:hypothetical protein
MALANPTSANPRTYKNGKEIGINAKKCILAGIQTQNLQASAKSKQFKHKVVHGKCQMLKVADGRSVQRVVAQPPLLGKGLSKVNDSRQWYKAYDKLL